MDIDVNKIVDAAQNAAGELSKNEDAKKAIDGVIESVAVAYVAVTFCRHFHATLRERKISAQSVKIFYKFYNHFKPPLF